MSTCRLIVCERTSRWATAVRAELAGRTLAIVETRSLAGCQEALADAPLSLAAIEVTAANFDAVRQFTMQVSRGFPQAAILALLAADAADADLLLREAGAVDCAASVLDVPRLVRLARRKLALAPPRDTTLSEFVADRLPWPTNASSLSPSSQLTTDH